MLICVIEFGTVPGMEERNRALVAELLVDAARIDGFLSKETFLSRDNPGKVVTLSYWRDAEALRTWMADPAHRRAIPLGRQALFTHYTIQLAEVVSDKVMAQVEMQCGPARIVSLMSTEAVEELDLKVGDLAVAVIKSTMVTVETPSTRSSSRPSTPEP